MPRLIDADALDIILKAREHDDWNKKAMPCSWSVAFTELREILEEQPTVDAEPVRHAHWIWERNEYYTRMFDRGLRPEEVEYFINEEDCACSGCLEKYNMNDHGSLFDESPNYCPKCGARMDEPAIKMNYEVIKQTRFEKLKGMSVDKLVNMIHGYGNRTICDIICSGECAAIDSLYSTAGEACLNMIKNWLETEVSEDEM